MYDAKLVSIIIPVYNRENLLIETLESIISQSYAKWEAIIVDDGSFDRSFEIATSYANKDNRISCLKRNREPKGAQTCRNIGANISKGDYIIFLDSDDLLHKHCLENRVKMFNEYPDSDYLVFQIEVFNKIIGDKKIIGNVLNNENDFYRFLRGDVLWSTMQAIWKRESLIAIGLWDESLKCWQEYELFMRGFSFGLNYKAFLNLPPDCFSRQHEFERIGKTQRNDLLYVISQEEILFKILNDFNRNINLEFKLNFRLIVLNVCFNYGFSGYGEYAEKLLNKLSYLKLYSNLQLLKIKTIIYLYRIKMHHVKGFYYLRSLLIKDMQLEMHFQKHKSI